MSKLLLPVLCLCLAAWLFGGAIWFGNQYSNPGKETSWKVEDGHVQFSSPTTFSFQKSDAEIILDENQHAVLAQISEYLIANPDRHLSLKGIYTESEMQNETYGNMGLARAESFRYLIYRQGVNLEQLHTSALKVNKHQLNSNGLIHGGVNFHFSESPLVKYGTAFSLNKVIQFEETSSRNFKNSDFEQYIASLRQYLVDYPGKKIQVIGHYAKEHQQKLTQKRVDYLEHKLSQAEIPNEKVSGHLKATDEASVTGSIVIKIL